MDENNNEKEQSIDRMVFGITTLCFADLLLLISIFVMPTMEFICFYYIAVLIITTILSHNYDKKYQEGNEDLIYIFEDICKYAFIALAILMLILYFKANYFDK